MAATGRETDEGMVTVEAAIALCALIVVVGSCLAGISAVTDQLRCTDAAREAARLVARGEKDRAGVAVERIAPASAAYTVQVSGDLITVDVTAPPLGELLPGVRVHGQAFAVAEPEAAEPGAVDAAR